MNLEQTNHLENIQKAAENLNGIIRKTELIYSEFFSKETGNRIYIKPENLQRTGSFKIRGAYNRIANLTEEERAEQQKLRAEYVANIRAGLRGQLNNIDIQEKDGSITNLGEKFGQK